jgi:hypothetical protein
LGIFREVLDETGVQVTQQRGLSSKRVEKNKIGPSLDPLAQDLILAVGLFDHKAEIDMHTAMRK